MILVIHKRIRFTKFLNVCRTFSDTCSDNLETFIFLCYIYKMKFNSIVFNSIWFDVPDINKRLFLMTNGFANGHEIPLPAFQ